MSSKLKPCPSCGKEVSKSAKVCPHCGKKLKMGMFLKFLIGLAIVIVLIIIGTPSEEERAAKLDAAIDEVYATTPANISPYGKLGEMFNLASDHTDIQRENKRNEITGMVVQWTLPVYEVAKRDNYYRVQTINRFGAFGGQPLVGTFINLYALNESEAEFIEGLKTEDMITIKGRITGTQLRNIVIDHAILMPLE